MRTTEGLSKTAAKSLHDQLITTAGKNRFEAF